jgi:AraC family transcriptional regulator
MTLMLVPKYPNACVKATSAQRAWPGLLVELLEHPAGHVSTFSQTVTELTVVLEGNAALCRQLDGGQPQRIEAMPGAMWLTLPGVREQFINFEKAIPQALHVYLTSDRFLSVCPRSRRCNMAIAALRRDAPFADTLVEEIARALTADLQTPDDSRLLTEPLALCLAARLLQDHSEASREMGTDQQRSGLDPRRLAKVTQHIAAHLDRDLSVDALAAVACLSPSRFAHGFKTSTGDAPQQYVSAKRIDRAKNLLLDTRLSLTEIARICGFSSQAAFTKAFARITSVTPGRYRGRIFADRAPTARLGDEGFRNAQVLRGFVQAPDLHGTLDEHLCVQSEPG